MKVMKEMWQHSGLTWTPDQMVWDQALYGALCGILGQGPFFHKPLYTKVYSNGYLKTECQGMLPCKGLASHPG